jgi:hypothetical protein
MQFFVKCDRVENSQSQCWLMVEIKSAEKCIKGETEMNLALSHVPAKKLYIKFWKSECTFLSYNFHLFTVEKVLKIELHVIILQCHVNTTGFNGCGKSGDKRST